MSEEFDALIRNGTWELTLSFLFHLKILWAAYGCFELNEMRMVL